MKYTLSEDGIERATVILKIRLEKEEIRLARSKSKTLQGGSSWHHMLESWAGLAIETELDEWSCEEKEP